MINALAHSTSAQAVVRCVGAWLVVTALAACSDSLPPVQVTGGDVEQGRLAIERYGCVACHVIPGIAGHRTALGPPLVHLAQQGYIAGVLPNTPEALVQWLRNPPAVDPRTVMPRLGLTSEEASHIAAYLYSRT